MDKELAVLQQGDQYVLRFIVKENGVEITAENCDEMKIKIGDVLFKSEMIRYSDGYWECLITQQMTLMWNGDVLVQAQWAYEDEGTRMVKTTKTEKIHVDCSIIREVWA